MFQLSFVFIRCLGTCYDAYTEYLFYCDLAGLYASWIEIFGALRLLSVPPKVMNV